MRNHRGCPDFPVLGVTYGLLRAAPHGYAATLLLDGTGTEIPLPVATAR
jgi:hypothetical protein